MSHLFESPRQGQASEFLRLSAQQQVSLEKHQQMVEDALQWQAHSRLAEAAPESMPVQVLRPVFSALLSLLTK